MKQMRLLVALLLACSLLAYGCGGGGGGGSTSGTTIPATTLSNNASAKSFIAKNVAGNFATLTTENGKLSLRAGLKAEIKIEDLDSSTIKVSYGPADSVTSSLGVNYTYTGGYQIVRAKDQYGNLAMSAATTNTIEISSHNLACNYIDGGDFLSVVGNGNLILTGFLSDTTFTVAAAGLNVNGTINGTDNFSMIVDDGSLTVTKTSFPYPKSGESESGKVIFNGAQYNYNINYDGTQASQCTISGAESFSFKLNMSNGAVIETSQPTTSDVYETGLASWYGDPYNGSKTASGELFDKNALTAAHKSLAFGTLVSVTNLENGRVVTVKINDRGPFVDSRILDVSEKAADELGMKAAGAAQVSLKIVGTAPIVKPDTDETNDTDNDSDTNPYDDESTPTITSVTPNSDNIGARATITGQGFGQTQGTVNIGGVSAQIISWSENSVQFRVPQVNQSGYQTLTLTAGGKQVNSTFNIAAPAVTSYSPSPVGKDQTLTIYGEHFGNADDQVTRTLYVKDYGYVNNVNWSDTSFSFVWPVANGLGTKTIELTVSVGGLTQSFDVTAD